MQLYALYSLILFKYRVQCFVCLLHLNTIKEKVHYYTYLCQSHLATIGLVDRLDRKYYNNGF